MSSANTSLRRVASVALAEGGQDTIDIPRTADIEAVFVRVFGTIATATGAATSVKNFAPSQLIKRLEFFADGAKTIEEADGRAAVFAAFERGPGIFTAPGTAVATHNVDAVFRLDRANFDGPRPKDSALHTSPAFISLLQLRMTYSAAILTDLWVPGAATLGAVNLTADVFVAENQEFRTSDNVEERFLRRVSLQELTIDATNSSFAVKLPVGSQLRGVKLVAMDDTGNGSNSVINAVKIRSGLNVRMDMTFDALRAENRYNYRIPAAEHVAGLAYADLTPDGRLNRLFDLSGASEAELVLDVTKPAGGNGSVIAQIVEYIPIPAAG